MQASAKIKALEREDDDFWLNVLRNHNYSAYLTKYPNGRHIKDAKDILAKIQAEKRTKENAEDNQYWEMAQQHKTYKAYLSKYPKGLHTKEAKDLLRQGNSVLEFIKDVIAIIIMTASLITFCYLIL